MQRIAARSSCSISFIHSSLVWCCTMNSISSCAGERGCCAFRISSRLQVVAVAHRRAEVELRLFVVDDSFGAHVRFLRSRPVFWLNSGRFHSSRSSTCTRCSTASHTSSKPQVQRREAEAQDVGHLGVAGAEVADHAARDQRLHDRVGARAAVAQREADLRAAPGVIARRHEREAGRRSALPRAR